jgi:hypothetical protein
MTLMNLARVQMDGWMMTTDHVSNMLVGDLVDPNAPAREAPLANAPPARLVKKQQELAAARKGCAFEQHAVEDKPGTET